MLFSLTLSLTSFHSLQALDEDAMAAILGAKDRNIAHVLRDDNRKPTEVVDFAGIDNGMRVLDVYAADGYYTYILARIVGESGAVYAQNPPAGSNVEDIRQMYSLADSLDERISIAELKNVHHLREGIFDLSITEASLDVVFLVQILHDFYNGDANYAAALMTHLTSLLKPGGIVIVIDHAGDAEQDNARLHRMQKTEALEIAAQAGLTLIGDSAILTNTSDRHRRSVFDPMLV